MSNILEDLNDAQRKAVEYIDGPSLVIAGAGSGKTRVLTYKIAYLLQQGVKPWSIMALTFTNKAAKEMKERIARLVGSQLAQYLFMGTFHSIFSRILRAEASFLGFSNNFTIYDESDSRSLLKTIIKDMGLDDKKYKPAAVHAKISMAKNHLMSAESYSSDNEICQRDLRAQMPSIGKIFQSYVQRCRQANAMDFDDLLVYTFQLFRDHDDVRKKYAERFDFFLVDEYQDTNYAQQAIVLQLCKEKQRVCAVGDDSQSIYSFRGANIDNILSFQNRFAGAKLFKLEQNYRSTQNIVNAANSLIKNNHNQIPKDVYSENDRGEKLVYRPAYSDKEEAAIVSKEIKRVKRLDDCEYSDFAILYRTNAQSRSFEEEFRRQGIPYRIYGGLSFYQRKEIKDIIAYFRLVANPDDEEAFKRIINYPARGIGSATVQKIADCAAENETSYWNAICSPDKMQLAVSKATLGKIERFRLLIEKYTGMMNTADVYTLGSQLVQESGITEDLFASKDAEAVVRQENLEEFMGSMKAFVSERQELGEPARLTDFLQDVALLTDLESKGDDTEARVSLMTIHAAKGLEFPTVFIVGLEENIFPNAMASGSVRDLEEERRLLYVAITRAEKRCILTNAKNRFRYGRLEFDNPSRFICEIDASLIDDKGEAMEGYTAGHGRKMPWNEEPSFVRNTSLYSANHPVERKSVSDNRPSMPVSREAKLMDGNFKPVRAVNRAHEILGVPSSAPASASNLSEGMRIEHQRFGIGEVVRIEGSGENTKATVNFVNAGQKQLLLKFAKFTIIK